MGLSSFDSLQGFRGGSRAAPTLIGEAKKRTDQRRRVPITSNQHSQRALGVLGPSAGLIEDLRGAANEAGR